MLYHCSTYRHRSTALHIDAMSWQRAGGTKPWLFLGLCRQISLTQKASFTRPLTPHNSCWERKGSSPCLFCSPRQADLRKCPSASCHTFSDWRWVKFGQSNCRSCCWPWAALNTSYSGAWLFPAPMLLELHLSFWSSSSSAFHNKLFAFGILWARRI